MNQEFYEDVYLSQCKHFSSAVRHEAEIIVFSAIPCSGKSEITKRLVEQYGYFRVANKDIRDAIESTKHANIDISDYTTWLFDKLIAQDRCSFVFDRNIDQIYPAMRHWAAENNYRFLLVSIDVTRKILKKRLLERDKIPSAKSLEMLDFYSVQHKLIHMNVQPDLQLKNNYDLNEASMNIAQL